MSSGQHILDYVYSNEKKYAGKTWFTQPVSAGNVTEYTWADSMSQIRSMVAHLNSLDLEPGSKIAMISKNCAHFMMAEVAIWMAGHVTVGLYPTLNADTAAFVLDHSDTKLLFVGKLDTWHEIEPGVPNDLPKIAFPLAPANDYPKWDEIVTGTEPVSGAPSRTREELAMIIYTSGSTGLPKGVMHNFDAISRAGEGIVRDLKFSPDDRVLSYLPLAHVFERAYISTTTLIAATHVFFAESLDTFVDDLNRARPTLFISVPRLWLKFQLGVFKKLPEKKLNFLLKLPIISGLIKKKVLGGLGLDCVRLAGSGSAPIPADLIAWYRKLGLNLLEGYAMSEDYAYSHLSTEDYNEPGYVGVPYAEVDVRISDTGEILINSPGKMMGYYKAPELTVESFTEDGFFKTGDRGERREPSGLLKITGRVKEIFKTSKGKYVAPAPIENIINNHSSVELSCVSGTGRPQPYVQLVVAEDLRDQLDQSAVRDRITAEMTQLLAVVNAKVEHHERLEFIVVSTSEWSISNDMLTPTMKIRRGAIEDATDAKVDAWYDAKQKVVWA